MTAMSSLESITIPSSTASQDPLPVLMKALTQDLKLPAEGITESDAFAIARLSEIVSTRGARLSACAIAAVVLQVGVKEKYSFGLDGSLIEHLPRFEERMRVALREVLGEEVERKIEMGLAKDGSGVGAALCAHAAIKQSISKA
jgi:hexokinase